MELLARKLGYAQLTEAVRFRNGWEGNASLAIRAGEVSALGIYDEHGRLHGGSYEAMAEQACRAYLAEYLAGLVDADGAVVDSAGAYFGHLQAAGRAELTVRSYAH